MTSKTDICNLALSAAMARSKITAIASDTSEEARICNLWYDHVLNHLIRAARWNFARETEALSLAGTPSSGSWRYRYTLPANYLRAWYMEGFGAFTISGQNILTNIASEYEPVLVYSGLVANPDNWDASFRMAMVYALAAHICGPLTGKVKQGQVLIGQANALVQAARTDAANEGYVYTSTQAPWILARDLTAETTLDANAPYFYPDGPEFAGVEQ